MSEMLKSENQPDIVQSRVKMLDDDLFIVENFQINHMRKPDHICQPGGLPGNGYPEDDVPLQKTLTDLEANVGKLIRKSFFLESLANKIPKMDTPETTIKTQFYDPKKRFNISQIHL